MSRLAAFIVKKRLIFTIIFAVLLVASIVCIFFVKINYNDTEYLPDNSETRKGLTIMKTEFGENGSAGIMISESSAAAAIEFKKRVAAIDGVAQCIWLDDLLSSALSPTVNKMNSNGSEITVENAVIYTATLVSALPADREPSYTELLLIIAAKFNSEEIPKVTEFFLALSDDFNLSEGFGALTAMKTQFDAFYRDNNAFIQVMFDNDDYAKSTSSAMKAILALDGNIHASGNSAMVYLGQSGQTKQVLICTICVVVIALIILFLTSSSYFEPLLYVMAIGVAIIINMGTNIIFRGGISYITNSVSCILQLALSIDYSIFLLTRFKRERAEGLSVEEAMIKALTKSMSPVSASSLTTMASFAALIFMKYKMGLDMGLVMGKGILISLLSVFLFLPGMVIFTHKILEKSEHKPFRPQHKKLSRALYKGRFVLPVIALCIIVPCAYFSYQNTYTYGNEASQGGAGSAFEIHKSAIEEVFGIQNTVAVLLPKNYDVPELSADLNLLESVTSVQSASIIKESGFGDMLPESFFAQFIGDAHHRIILNINCPEEGAETDAALADIHATLLKHGVEDYYLMGNSPAAVETREITGEDYNFISLIAILLVGAVLLITYRNPLLPLLLLAVIEGSIWINMAFPYFLGQEMVFLGYMIICNILLGSTIDYAILMTSNYIEARKNSDRQESMSHAIGQSLRALLTSAGIFTFGGAAIGLFMSMPTVNSLGYAIMRGGISAFMLVIFVLPPLLVVCDKLIKPLKLPRIKKRTKKNPI